MSRYQSLSCDDDERRQAVLNHPDLNGIDYIEVDATTLDSQRFLRVYFLKTDFIDDLAGKPNLFTLTGGVRVQSKSIRILDVTRVDDHLVVEVSQAGDFSTYILGIKIAWLDRVFSQQAFSFKASCPTNFDCRTEEVCEEEPAEAPLIDYMAKDYASFRQALLDLIPSLAPDWLERNPADMGIMLVELLAYTADQLSYYQDSVANEAFLETARQRISVRRHARLIDYHMHDGVSARTFIHVMVQPGGAGVIPARTPALTRIAERVGSAIPGSVIDGELRDQAETVAEVVFETVTAAYVHPDLSEIELYEWGDKQCCLAKGAMEIDLVGNLTPLFSPDHLADEGALAQAVRDKIHPVAQYIYDSLTPAEQAQLAGYLDGDPLGNALRAALLASLNGILTDVDFYQPARFAAFDMSQQINELVAASPGGDQLVRLNRLLLEAVFDSTILARSALLAAGHYLLFEEVIGPTTGEAADADTNHRQVVRLTGVTYTVDKLDGTELTNVTWDRADALTFPLCLSSKVNTSEYSGVSVARGNLILVDHGQAIAGEAHAGPIEPNSENQRRAHRFLLDEGPLSFRLPLPKDNGQLAPAVKLLEVDPRLVMPQITRLEVSETTPDDDWLPVPTLLDSDGFDHHFAVETNNNGRALVRFGDDQYGQAPPDGSAITVDYRVGVGTEGNVGREMLVHLVRPETSTEWPDVATVRNPLPAWGGAEPESMEEVRRLAPAAFRSEQRRAVTEEDYARAAELHPEVDKAVATFRWTGSWHTVFVTIDPVGRVDAPLALQRRVRNWVQRFTQAGYDLEIDPPSYVPLEIEVDVCVSPNHFKSDVQEALLVALGSESLPAGRKGFFHPDNFSFGQSLYLSQLYSAIEEVEGVDSAEVKIFKRFAKSANQELEKGYIPMGRLEVVRLDNDPNFPENGVLRMNMLGGK